MKKEKFLEPEMNIIWFETEDVISTSGFLASLFDPEEVGEQVISGLSSFWGRS